MNTTEQLKKEIPILLAEISNHLIINGSMVISAGLLYGKLGISLYFYNYWHYTGNSLYREYARHLINLVKVQINDDYPLDYENGFAGIGAGFDYLKKNLYYDVGDDWMKYVDSKMEKENKIDEAYFSDSKHAFIKKTLENILKKEADQFTNIQDLQLLLQCEQLLEGTEYQSLIPEVKRRIADSITSLNTSMLDELFSGNHDFSFQGGYAGLGLALMAALDSEYISWTKLLRL